MYFSINWERIHSKRNINLIRATFLNEQGERYILEKYYEQWIGVCTSNIDKVVRDIKFFFPGHNVVYRQISEETKKILPYFEERLAKGKLDYSKKPFYKVYTTASHENIGRFLKKYKISYYEPEEWLTRLYIDLCTRHNSFFFYYMWYEVNNDSQNLLDSLHMVPERLDQPDWTIGAFDLETVPLVGDEMPRGYVNTDRIVMVSLYKWNRHYGIQKWILYLLPEGIQQPLQEYEYGYKTEGEMLLKFHELLKDVQILSGYNINSYDLPFILARLVFLRFNKLALSYTSKNVGSVIVVYYDNKVTLDLYPYFHIFSNYNLPSYKLDDIAREKLENVTKIPVKSVGISSWYKYKKLPRWLFELTEVEPCFQMLQPAKIDDVSQFGTFITYLKYCLRDSELVHCLLIKEHVISFLTSRANFTALNMVQALHLGNSRYLVELVKTYGTKLGYFCNINFFKVDLIRYQHLLNDKGKYQGALNYCLPEQVYSDVAVMDFSSMYPSCLVSNNLCYGTCTIMRLENWYSLPQREYLVAIPYREHSNADFNKTCKNPDTFYYPEINPKTDKYVIVINQNTEAFLPKIVTHFIQLRKYHQNEYKKTNDIYHYNVQLGTKILINSLYGIMGNKDSCFAYLPLAITIVTLARYQLLGSYHYLKNRGYKICYADTDSLMVHKWPVNNCDEINAFLNLPHVELKFEQRMQRLVVLSKKRYAYEPELDDTYVMTGFAKKINDLVKFMSKEVLDNVWKALFYQSVSSSNGWVVWVEILLEANYKCRDPKKYSIYRKLRNIEEYKSSNCPSVKYLKKYPDRGGEHVEFTYGRADIALSEASNWVMDVEDCQWVNFEQLFMSQKKTLCMLMNMAYWHLPDPTFPTDMILNTIHWRRFVHAELLHWHRTGRRIIMLIEPSVKYTFIINDHIPKEKERGRKRMIVELQEEEMEQTEDSEESEEEEVCEIVSKFRTLYI